MIVEYFKTVAAALAREEEIEELLIAAREETFDVPHLPALAAVLVCAYAGIWRALFVAIAGLLLGFYFFVQPYESFSEPDAEDFGAIVLYLLTTLVMLFLVEWLRRSKYETQILMLETKYRNKRLEEVLASLSEARNSASTNAQRVDMLAATVPHIWSTRRSGGKIEYFNAKLYEITGMPHGSLDGEGWTNAMHPQDAESVDEVSRRVERTGVRDEPLDRIVHPLVPGRQIVRRLRDLLDTQVADHLIVAEQVTDLMDQDGEQVDAVLLTLVAGRGELAVIVRRSLNRRSGSSQCHDSC